jgi:hypothetical protein
VRTEALLLAGVAALLPAFGGQAAAQPAETASQTFVPPEAPLVLTRTVWRTLADGKEIMVRRRYAVQFTRQAEGYQLDGRLLDAAVEAPPLLDGMAELERRRGDDGLFPVLLDASGRIRAHGSAQAESPGLRESASKRAQHLLAATPLPAAQRQDNGNFLSQLAAQGALAAWPADLFNPASSERSEHHRFALPGGQEGEVAVLVKAKGVTRRGLPESVERTVTTTMEGTLRTSREQWTLAPAQLPQ